MKIALPNISRLIYDFKINMKDAREKFHIQEKDLETACRSLFKTLLNIQDGAFYENS